MPVDLSSHPQGFMMVYQGLRAGDQLRTRIDLVRDEGDMDLSLFLAILGIDGSFLGTGESCHILLCLGGSVVEPAGRAKM